MVSKLTAYKIFIASPSGLEEERKSFKKTLNEYSEDEAYARDIVFIPVGWEETLGGIGNPQSKINEDLKKCDFIILLLWDRWGSKPSNEGESKYSSGTEEEYYLAVECLGDPDMPMKDIIVLFKGVEERQLSDPGDQLKKVLNFKRKLEKDKTLLHEPFDSVDEFNRIIRRHLSRFVRDNEENSAKKVIKSKVTTVEDIIEESKFLHDISELKNTDQLINEAEILANKGAITDAEAIYAKAIVGSTDLQAIISYGRFLRRCNRLSHSKSTFEKLEELAIEFGDKFSLATAYSNLGIIYRDLNSKQKAIEFLKTSIEIAKELGQDGEKILAYNLGNLGTINRQLGYVETARSNFEEALEIQKKIDDFEGQAHTLGSLGVMLRKIGELSDSVKYHEMGMEIAKTKLGDEGLRPFAFNCSNLGYVLEELGDYPKAQEKLEKSLEINRKLNHSPSVAFNIAFLARLYLKQDDLEEATKKNQESLTINNRLNIIRGIAFNQHIFGDIEYVKNKFIQALDKYNKSLELNKNILNKEGMAENYQAIGKTYLKLKDKELAKENFSQAISIYNEIQQEHNKKKIKEILENIINKN